jgi:hypothetical protein
LPQTSQNAKKTPMAPHDPSPVPVGESLEARFFAFLHARYPPHAIFTLGVFALCGVGFGAALLKAWPSPEALGVALTVLVLLSFQLAVADAVRDQAHADGRWSEPIGRRPLLVLAFGAGVAQLILTLALHPPLLGPLALSWLVIGLASQDFFIPDLARRPALSVGLHLIGLGSAGYFVAGAELFRQSGQAHGGLLAFGALTITAGLMLELARKSFAPEEERAGAPSYSKAWGPKIAGMGVACGALGALAATAGAYLGLGAYPGLIVPAILLGAATFLISVQYGLSPSPAWATRMRLAALAFVIACFTTIGIAPLVLRLSGHS